MRAMGIRVASLNVWALPANLASHEAPRMAAIAGEISRVSPDLLAFQEVWTQASRDTLVAGARAAGLESIWHPESSFGSSGLVIASRFPIERVHFEAYEARGYPERLRHLDYWGGKGFVIAEIEMPEGRLAFANTHLHANYAQPGRRDIYVGVRAAQLVQFAHGLRPYRHLPTIAVGDYNLVESEEGYRIWLGLTGLGDVAATLDRREATSRAGNPYRRLEKGDKRIDYMTQRPGTEARWVAKQIDRAFDAPLHFDGEPGNYSDHAGLVAVFEHESLDEVGRAGGPDPVAIEAARRLVAEGRAASLRRRRRQRGVAAAGAASAVGAGLAMRTRHTTRRKFMRGSLAGIAACGATLGTGALWLSEWMHPEEIGGFETADAHLDLLARDADSQTVG